MEHSPEAWQIPPGTPLYIKQVAIGKVSNLPIQILAICQRNNNLFPITNTYIHI